MKRREWRAMRIREARLQDAAAIARVSVDTWRTTYAGIVPMVESSPRLSYRAREAFWRDVLGRADDSGFVFVAEDEQGEVVGYVWGGPESSGDPEYEGELYSIYVRLSHQRRGIGRRLVHAAAQRLAKMGMRSMLVWVLADNPYRRFYAALGGEPVREKEIEVEGVPLLEVAYGWRNVNALEAAARPSSGPGR